MRGRMLLVVLALSGAATVARADCGSIPFKPHVAIFEPNQRALIAFNGSEEILLLSTDLRASEPTKVLEVIPFPNKPTVDKGDQEAFVRATRLINRKLQPRRPAGAAGGMGGMGGFGPAVAPPAGEVVFQKKIGAHDVSVVHVLKPRRFVEWVEEYLKKAGVDNPTIPEPLRPVVDEYVDSGFQWFAFNVVELGKETLTKEAIQYRFKTGFLYYPLKISRTDQGETTVTLLVVSPRLVKLPDLGPTRVQLVHEPLPISSQELRDIDKNLGRLLEIAPQRLLRTWKITAPLASFQKDVVTTW